MWMEIDCGTRNRCFGSARFRTARNVRSVGWSVTRKAVLVFLESKIAAQDEWRVEMNKQQKTGQSLVALGCLILLIGSLLHLIVAYPRVSMALATSNLDNAFRNALRAVFLMIGLTWIVIAVVTLIATFARSQTSKPIVLFCGFTLLLQIPIWVYLMGWFVGNEMFVVAGGLIVCGGLLFRDWRSV
jgi:hypothetical protein